MALVKSSVALVRSALSTAHTLGRQRRFQYANVRSASTEISVERLLRLLGSGIRILLEQRDRRHHEARRAEAAHQSVVVAEGLLHRMKRCAIREAIDGPDVLPLRFDREHRARVIRSPFDNDRARAARAAIADTLLSGDLESGAHRIEQRDPGLDAQLMPLPVDRQRDRNVTWTDRRRPLSFGITDAGDHGGGDGTNPDRPEKVAAGYVFVVLHPGRIRLFTSQSVPGLSERSESKGCTEVRPS